MSDALTDANKARRTEAAELRTLELTLEYLRNQSEKKLQEIIAVEHKKCRHSKGRTPPKKEIERKVKDKLKELQKGNKNEWKSLIFSNTRTGGLYTEQIKALCPKI